MSRFVDFFPNFISIIRIFILLLGPCVDKGPKSPNFIFQLKFFSHPSQFQKGKFENELHFQSPKVGKEC
jgi:hypothetical protein